MKKTLLTGTILAILAGCDKPSANQPEPDAAPSQAPVQSTPAAEPAATAPTTLGPQLVPVGGRLNDVKDMLDAHKWDEAEKELKAIDAIKDKISVDDQKRLESLTMVLQVAKNTGLTQPKN